MLGGGFGAIGSALIKILPDMSGFADKVGTEVEKGVSAKLGGIGATLTKTLTPVALAVGGAMAGIASKWNTGVDAIRAQTGKTGEALKQLVNDAKQVAGTVVLPFEQIAEVVAVLNRRLDLTGKPLQDLTRQVADFSHATGTDAVVNATALADALVKWKIPGENAAAVLDQILVASQETNTPVGQLIDQVARFSGVFKTLGLDMPGSLALIGSLKGAGLDAEKVFSAVNTGIANLSKGLKEKIPPSIMDIDGIGDAWRRAREQIAEHDIAGAMATITTAIKTAGTDAEARAIAIEVFGKKAGPALAAALRSGAFSVDKLTKKIRNSEGATKRTSDAMTHFGDRVGQVWDKVATTLGPISEKAAVAATVVAGIGPALQGLGKAGDFAGPVVKGMGRIVASAAGAATGAVASAAVQIASWIATAAAAVASAAVVAGAWLIAAAPFILIGLAVAAVAALIFFHWEKIRDFFLRTWEWIRNTAVSIWNGILGFFKQWGIYLLAILLGPVGLVVALVVRNWEKIKAFTSSVWDAITGFISGAVDRIRSTVVGAFNAISSRVGAVFSAIRSAAVSTWNAVVGTISRAIGRIIEWIQRAIGWFKKLAFWRSSPSLLEKHAAATMKGLEATFAKLPMPSVNQQLRLTPALATAAPTGQAAAGTGQGGEVHYHYELAVTTRESLGPIRQDFRLMEAMSS